MIRVREAEVLFFSCRSIPKVSFELGAALVEAQEKINALEDGTTDKGTAVETHGLRSRSWKRSSHLKLRHCQHLEAELAASSRT